MNDRNRTVLRRAVAAYDTLRGRPARPDYGLLLVLPLLAAAGGALISLGFESIVERRRDAGRGRLSQVGAKSPGLDP